MGKLFGETHSSSVAELVQGARLKFNMKRDLVVVTPRGFEPHLMKLKKPFELKTCSLGCSLDRPCSQVSVR